MSYFSPLTILILISTLSLYTYPTFSQKTTCKSLKLTKTFENCNDLPTLNAILHWTYNPSNSSLSVAFTASPPKPDGWVAWGLNPNGTGMVGAQVFLAHKSSTSGSMVVNTYDLRSYGDISMGPISYKVSSLSAQDTSGVITIFGSWALPNGGSKLNHVWQVGPMVNGNVGKHDFGQANLGSKGVLSLTSAGPVGAPKRSPSGPVRAPARSPSAGAPSKSVETPEGAPLSIAPTGSVGAPGGSPSDSALSPSGAGVSPSAPGSSPSNVGDRLVSGFLALGAMVVFFLF